MSDPLREALIISALLGWGLGLSLLVYLHLRVHALKQSRDLPPSTPDVFRSGVWPWGAGLTVDLLELYSRRYRQIDAHTRRIVPVIRVLLPLSPALLLLALAAPR